MQACPGVPVRGGIKQPDSEQVRVEHRGARAHGRAAG